jgi:hypothetical protein
MQPPNLTANPRTELFPTAMRAMAVGLIVLVLLVTVDQFSVHVGFTGVKRLGDNLLGGVIVAVIIFLDERRRQRHLAGRLHVIALMNHHVRNSLQTIMFAHNTEKEVEFIHGAVLRIEWALREILPGAMIGNESSAQRGDLIQFPAGRPMRLADDQAYMEQVRPQS